MKKAAIGALAVLVLLIAIIFVARSFVLSRAHALPENSPAHCEGKSRKPGLPRVLVLGDSITHGRVSANYVDLLARRYRGTYTFINAGVNSHLAWEALQRLKPALKSCAPKIVLVLIGTNDVNSIVRSDALERNMMRGLPRKPTPEWYEENLRRLLRSVKTAGVKTIALYTLPLIGEEVASPENERVGQYNGILRRVAAQNGATVLPLHETMRRFLKGRKIAGRCAGRRYPIEEAVALHYLFGRSWNEISRSFGFHLLTDCVHLNQIGATMMADLARPVLGSYPLSPDP